MPGQQDFNNRIRFNLRLEGSLIADESPQDVGLSGGGENRLLVALALGPLAVVEGVRRWVGTRGDLSGQVKGT